MKLYADLTYDELTVMRYATMEERNAFIHNGNPLSIINDVYLNAWKPRNRDVIKVKDPETGKRQTLYRFRFEDERFIEKILEDYAENHPDTDVQPVYDKIVDYHVRGSSVRSR